MPLIALYLIHSVYIKAVFVVKLYTKISCKKLYYRVRMLRVIDYGQTESEILNCFINERQSTTKSTTT